MKNNDKQYDKKIVTKPWGYEYVAYREKNKLAVTFLNIFKGKSTSLHCHPLKKTGFILLEGKAKIQLGLWKAETKIYKAPSKLMIRTGLFHSVKAISTNSCSKRFLSNPDLPTHLRLSSGCKSQLIIPTSHPSLFSIVLKCSIS